MPERRGRLAICNRCEKPITGLVFIDPRGGYFKKPEHVPAFLPRMAKVTYDQECNDLVRGKRPQAQPAATPQERQQELGTKILRKLAQKIVDTMRADKKRQWNVWDVICTLKQIASQNDLRAACNWLKKEGFLQRKNGALWVHPTKPLP